jgi:hypothetical protein
LPSIISGIPGHAIEDVKISDVYLHQAGGAGGEMAGLQPPEKEDQYPDPMMFGELPASGIFARHVRNLELSNVEVATEKPDARPAFWLKDVADADLFRVKFPRDSRTRVHVEEVEEFRIFGSRQVKDTVLAKAAKQDL